MSETSNRFNMPVPSEFNNAHRCWLEIGGESFASQFISGPDPKFYRTEYWKTVREIVLRRDSFLCVKCHGPANQVHHLNYRYVGRDHFFSKSLISVCSKCHGLFEHLRRTEIFLIKLRKLSTLKLATFVHTYAKFLEYRHAVTDFREYYYSGVPHRISNYTEDEDGAEALEEIRQNRARYIESANAAIATIEGDDQIKENYFLKLLEKEVAICESFLKESLGSLYGWEKEYFEKQTQTDNPRKIAIEKASLLAKEAVSKLDFDAKTIVGKCPKCGGNVVLQSIGYFCENHKNTSASCKFNVKIEILRRHIEPDQVSKLLQTGRTDLLENFISNSGKAFSAYLVLASGRIVFEFSTKSDGTMNRP